LISRLGQRFQLAVPVSTKLLNGFV
jgi:hypothetical protein